MSNKIITKYKSFKDKKKEVNFIENELEDNESDISIENDKNEIISIPNWNRY